MCLRAWCRGHTGEEEPRVESGLVGLIWVAERDTLLPSNPRQSSQRRIMRKRNHRRSNSIALENRSPIEEIREAYRHGNLTLYLGAGVSKGNGLPTWAEL